MAVSAARIRDDLVEALRRLVDASRPVDHIVIEASGVSRPLAIIEALEAPHLADRVHLDGVFALIDAAGFGELGFADTELALDQAFSSDVVLLNKCDLADETALVRIEQALRGPMPHMRLVRTTQAAIPRDLLFGPEPLGRRERAIPAGHDENNHAHEHAQGHDHHDGHEHAHAFRSWSWSCTQPLELRAFRAALRELPQELLRAKGILDIGGKRAVFQLVGKRKELKYEEGPPPGESRLVAIARSGVLDEGWMERLFDPA
ncbi:MAG: GTP-binding protein [Geminicoccaceae bacterium]